MERQTPELWGRCSRVGLLRQLASDDVLAQSSVPFSVGLLLLTTKIHVPSFLFSNLWQHVRGNCNASTATENLQEESLSQKFNRANLRKFRNTFAPPKIARSQCRRYHSRTRWLPIALGQTILWFRKWRTYTKKGNEHDESEWNTRSCSLWEDKRTTLFRICGIFLLLISI